MLEACFFILSSPSLRFVSSERGGKGYASFFLCLTLRLADYTSVAIRRDMTNGERGSEGAKEGSVRVPMARGGGRAMAGM